MLGWLAGSSRVPPLALCPAEPWLMAAASAVALPAEIRCHLHDSGRDGRPRGRRWDSAGQAARRRRRWAACRSPPCRPHRSSTRLITLVGRGRRPRPRSRRLGWARRRRRRLTAPRQAVAAAAASGRAGTNPARTASKRRRGQRQRVRRRRAARRSLVRWPGSGGRQAAAGDMRSRPASGTLVSSALQPAARRLGLRQQSTTRRRFLRATAAAHPPACWSAGLRHFAAPACR